MPAPADILPRARAQEILFAPIPNRADLLSLPEFAAAKTRRIAVVRNHAIEPMHAQMEQYARFGGWRPEWHVSEYDDSLSFRGLENGEHDAALFWINPRQYETAPEERARWLAGRCAAFRNISDAPAVLATWTEDEKQSALLAKLLEPLAGFYYADIAAAAAQTALLDGRRESATGTPLSRAAQNIAAREIACRWLPAILFEPLKAVLLDLDGTLHRGVLGEDGPGGVQLPEGHRKFQQALKSLPAKGVLLGLISRNEESDVRELFQRRRDYPLRWEDFSAATIGWRDKAESVCEAAMQMRIAPDAALLVDDNPGELLSVAARLPEANLLWADEDAEKTARALAHYPRLWRFTRGREDAARGADLAANAARAKTWEAAQNEDEYFRQLEIHLRFAVNPRRRLARMAQLANKTNQFNLSLRRTNEAQTAALLDAPACDAVAVSLSDRLCDSGVIAFVAAAREGAVLAVREICISCRALGRKLESAVIFGALQRMPNFKKCESVKFDYARGPRNEPALAWLKTQTGGALPDGGAVLSAAQIASAAPNPFISAAEETDE
ncbi:MAG: HAD-IIIC family phosphatase [Gammaproteobacteria bacterium]